MFVRKCTALLLCALLVPVWGITVNDVAWAQAPQGGPPVNEGICDELMNATPGLYGLCVAFWAQDCEPDFGAANPFAACKPGAQKILEIYAKKAGAGDPPMPGIQAPCPCWTPDELAGLRYPAVGDGLSCRKDEDLPEFKIVNLDTWGIFKVEDGITFYNTNVATVGDNLEQGPVCGIADTCLDGNCLDILRVLNISQQELIDCEEAVAASAYFRGLNLESLDCL